MEPELEQYLRQRGISTHIIETMNAEKIDMAAIVHMEENELRTFIKKLGDRIAIKNFCKRTENVDKRMSLLEKLRKKIEEKDATKGQQSSSSEPGPSCSRRSSNKKKTTRMISLGWIRNNVQVRSKNGGGTRRLSVPKCWKKSDILKKAIELFFPGKEYEQELEDCTLLDFKRQEFDDDLTVEDIYDITKITTFVFYLSTTKIENSSDENEENDKNDENNGNGENDENNITTANLNTQENNVSDDSFQNVITSIHDDFTFDEFVTFPSTSPLLPIELSAPPVAPTTSSLKLSLHRGQVFNELIENFKEVEDVNTRIEVQMVLPNGSTEAAFDGGGVYRDALCEFWIHFYDICCVGNVVKVPVVKPKYDTNEWQAVAKILLNGFLQTGYFPSKLCRPFIEQVFFNKVYSDLTDAFLLYVGPDDADLLKKSLEDSENANYDDLIEVFDYYQCTTRVNSGNLRATIFEVARTEIIQKPMFIIDVWAEILRNNLIYNQIDDIYEKRKVNNKNVLNLIKVSDNIVTKESQVLNYLKRFLRETSINMLENFLRFCTGSNNIVTDEIHVLFNESKGLERCPVAHTCTFVLELSVNYESYSDFQYELKSVLTSSVWVMDIV